MPAESIDGTRGACRAARREDQVQGLWGRALGEELVNEAVADGEADSTGPRQNLERQNFSLPRQRGFLRIGTRHKDARCIAIDPFSSLRNHILGHWIRVSRSRHDSEFYGAAGALSQATRLSMISPT